MSLLQAPAFLPCNNYQREDTPYPFGKVSPFYPSSPISTPSLESRTSSGITYDRLALDEESVTSDDSNNDLTPAAEHLVNNLFGNPLVFISSVVTRSNSMTETYAHPVVTYRGIIVQIGATTSRAEFSIKDDQFPTDHIYGIDFSPFFDAVKAWHNSPKHKWNASNSKKMAGKPLWKTHPNFKRLLKYAQKPKSIHSRR